MNFFSFHVLTLASSLTLIGATHTIVDTSISSKKGIGLSEKQGVGAEQLQLINASWYYNWSSQTSIQSDIPFVPMVFSVHSMQQGLPTGDVLLGFNEPDNEKQANTSVKTALHYWDTLAASATRIGSPAIAGNPLKKNNWLDSFMMARPTVHFIAVHWYKGCNAEKFIADIKAIIEHYKLPVWVTEFAAQTGKSSRKDPTKYTQLELNAFIQTSIEWMEQEPMVERYAWHDSKTGTCAIYTEKGQLTETGKAYRDALGKN